MVVPIYSSLDVYLDVVLRPHEIRVSLLAEKYISQFVYIGSSDKPSYASKYYAFKRKRESSMLRVHESAESKQYQ